MWWMGLASVAMFIGSLLVIPILVARIPEDYFVDEKQTLGILLPVSPTTRLVLRIIKNIFGVLFVLAGILMLVLPGQGILSILVGITLLDFPGKQALQHRIVRRPAVFKTVNWIRKRRGKPPIRLEGRRTTSADDEDD